MKTFETKNPYTQKTIKKYELISDEVLNEKLEQGETQFQNWKSVPIKKRTELLTRVAELLIERKESYANLMADEMGKPIAQGVAEVEKCAWVCDFYAKNAEDFLADQLIETDASQSFISYDPLGMILAVMPWNYPFWQVMRFAAPTLTAGNVAVLKHASSVAGCALEFQKLFEDAGYPEGCFQTLLVDHDQIEDIIGNPIIKAVTLTGSEGAGRKIAEIAGKNLKKTVLELGGNNACIILNDVNLDEHIETIAWARMQNNGQSCIAAKRFLVQSEIYDEFLERFKSEVENYKIGNPTNKDSKITCMASESMAEEVEGQVQKSMAKGATLYYGNERQTAYYQPTLITDVEPGMPLFDEEVFGPVAAIIKFETKDEAYKLASDSKLGLGAMIFTEDVEDAKHRISEIEDGAFFINDMVKSDPRLPFGGTKASGYGRELSKEGMMEFVNRKTVYVK